MLPDLRRRQEDPPEAITSPTFTGEARVRNQFVPNGVTLPMGTADMLCAPTEKLKFSIVKP